MKFCGRRGIHLISDEIYALSTYSNPTAPPSQKFTSILSIENKGYIDPKLLHVIYGMSKVPSSLPLTSLPANTKTQDFSANGLRLGAFISQNSPWVIKGMSSVAQFYWPSGISDKAWTSILNSSTFLEKFISTNSDRLSLYYRKSTDILKKHNIKYHTQG